MVRGPGGLSPCGPSLPEAWAAGDLLACARELLEAPPESALALRNNAALTEATRFGEDVLLALIPELAEDPEPGHSPEALGIAKARRASERRRWEGFSALVARGHALVEERQAQRYAAELERQRAAELEQLRERHAEDLQRLTQARAAWEQAARPEADQVEALEQAEDIEAQLAPVARLPLPELLDLPDVRALARVLSLDPAERKDLAARLNAKRLAAEVARLRQEAEGKGFSAKWARSELKRLGAA